MVTVTVLRRGEGVPQAKYPQTGLELGMYASSKEIARLSSREAYSANEAVKNRARTRFKTERKLKLKRKTRGGDVNYVCGNV